MKDANAATPAIKAKKAACGIQLQKYHSPPATRLPAKDAKYQPAMVIDFSPSGARRANRPSPTGMMKSSEAVKQNRNSISQPELALPVVKPATAASIRKERASPMAPIAILPVALGSC